ncbi:hypothetical protein P8452_47903 [Trifolium repens]|nr:hypothetical protein P8452_47903 [Trifolium repens]
MAFTKSNSRLSTIVRNEDVSTPINKKLFSTPSPRPPLSSRCNRGSTSSKGKKVGSGSTSRRRAKSVLPKGIRWTFPVTTDSDGARNFK